jgi:hypothetical protein
MADRLGSVPESLALVVEAAKCRIAQVERGDTAESREALRMGARSIRDVLEGRAPDAEQSVYLEFIARALDEICAGIDPKKALGLFGNKGLPIDRDIALFMAVGSALDAIERGSDEIEKPVEGAITAIAERTQIGRSTVAAAWKNLGGEDAWRAAKEL